MDYSSKKFQLQPWIFHLFFKLDPWNLDFFIFNTPGNWAIPEKIQAEGDWGNGFSIEVLKKKQVKIPAIKEVEFPGVFTFWGKLSFFIRTIL